MNELNKTLTFVGTAVVLGLLAFVTRPGRIGTDDPAKPVQVLFEDFKDALAAKSLEITRFDEKSGEIHEFKVEQTAEGRWVIPSHSNYPADAETQLRDVATSLINLSSVDVMLVKPDQHKDYQLLQPEKNKAKLGDKGYGTLIRVQGEKGKNLAELIIGDKDAKSGDLRFVRRPGQDHVFVVKYNVDKLATTFDKWIEKDLLQLNALDVERIRLKDYAVIDTTEGTLLDMRMEAGVKWDSAGSKWDLEELATYNQRQKVATQLLEDEELNKEKLDGLKTALDSLEIVSVERKPKGLSVDLRADDSLFNDREGRKSLSERGFLLASLDGKNRELLAANGEVHVSMKEGYDYVLRFGEVAGRQEGSDEGKLNRYLFVTARFDASKFPPPELEPEPPADPQPAGPAAVPAPDTKKNAPPAGGQDGDGAAADGETKKDEPKKEDAPKAVAPVANVPDEKKAPEKQADEKQPDEKKGADDAKAKADAERERIKKENQRKLNDYNEKKTKAENRVYELNSRFADWYYVISEDTYKKIHLSRADIIKEKSGSKDEGYGIDAFRKLEKEGLQKKDAPAK